MLSILRLLQLGLELVGFGFAWFIERLHLSRSALKSPQRLRLTLARLGPTFIKFGQALSMRRDMLPDAYIGELQSLQDHIAPFSAQDAIAEIEHGLQRPLKQLFVRFDQEPLAAASVAQVHTACLHDGREVIVKVRRIGIEAQIDRDMRALRMLTGVAAVLILPLRHYRPLRIVDEIWRNLRKEIDFRQEARNIRPFVAAFADWPTIHIPGVIENFVSESVIVQERSGGRRIDDPTIGSEGPALALAFVDAYLHQIFVLGVFHGDPHPGNLFITNEGRICFHDFGLIGILDRPTRRKLAAFTNAFLRQDANWFLDAAIDLGVLGGDMDRAVFQHGLAEIIADYAMLPIKEWSLAEAFLRVMQLGQAQNVFIPYDLVVLMRAMFLAEHVVRILDPNFQLLEHLQTKGPAVLKFALEPALKGSLDRFKHDAAATLDDLPAIVASWIRRIDQEGIGLPLNLDIHGLEGLEQHLDRGTNRLALALVTLGLYIAGSLLMQESIGPKLYGHLPVLAVLAYGLALWFTFRLARGIARSGRL
jgi:ubiquinone biosynthesis protein